MSNSVVKGWKSIQLPDVGLFYCPFIPFSYSMNEMEMVFRHNTILRNIKSDIENNPATSKFFPNWDRITDDSYPDE